MNRHGLMRVESDVTAVRLQLCGVREQTVSQTATDIRQVRLRRFQLHVHLKKERYNVITQLWLRSHFICLLRYLNADISELGSNFRHKPHIPAVDKVFSTPFLLQSMEIDTV